MKFLVRLLIMFYQRVISPPLHWIGGPGSGCRYEPSCSQYFLEAVETCGVIKGSWLGVKRICRCHPWGGFGLDPVPGSARDLELRKEMQETNEGCGCAEASPGQVTRGA